MEVFPIHFQRQKCPDIAVVLYTVVGGADGFPGDAQVVRMAKLGEMGKWLRTLPLGKTAAACLHA